MMIVDYNNKYGMHFIPGIVMMSQLGHSNLQPLEVYMCSDRPKTC